MHYMLNKIMHIHYFGDEAIIINRENGQQFFLNSTELDIIERLHNGIDLKQLINMISLELNLEDKKEIEKILQKFIQEKLAQQIIEPVEIFIARTLNTTGMKGYQYPLNILLEITNKCNLKCVHCYKEAGYEKNNDISFINLADKLILLKGKIMDLQISGGEPMSHKNFKQIIRFCIENFRTTITTAATMINKHNIDLFKGISDVQVSLYSANSLDHEKITLLPGSYKRTLNGIKLLVEKNINVTVSSIVTKSNLESIEPLINLCISLGVKVVKFGEFSRYGRGLSLGKDWEMDPQSLKAAEDLIEELGEKYNKQIEVLNWKDDRVTDKPFDTNHKGFSCGAGNLSWTISEFGNIKPCVFLPEDRFKTGNIFDDDFIKLLKKDHIKNLYKNMKEWESELLQSSMDTEKICPVMSNYSKYFGDYLESNKVGNT
jgi:radical SAM protein with 4Fe4S-binding SPASM domain